MAISLNALPTGSTLGGRLALSPALPIFRPPPAPSTPPPASPPLAPPPLATTVTVNPGAVGIGPVLSPPIQLPPTFFPPIPSPVQQNKTTSQLATGAIAQLTNVVTTSATQALNAIKSRSVDGPGLIPYLERKVRIGEVLNDLAKDWTAATRTDFADAFNMDPNNLNNDVADSIVSIAILNDKDLEPEITAENTPQTTPADLTDNRRIIWQSVPPGTPLNPPYVILVAVEYQDIATAADVLKSITDQLGTTASGFRLPKAVIQKGVN